MRWLALCAVLCACDPSGTEPTPIEVKPVPAVAEAQHPPAAVAARPREIQARVVGSKLEDWGEVRWLQGEGTPGGVDLLVFWELWCPHCRREVPALEKLAAEHEGLEVLGLTRLTRNGTAEEVLEFAKEQGVSYPIGVVGQDLADRLAIRGVPAAAAVIDGRVVWRGHPAELDDATVQGWLAAR